MNPSSNFQPCKPLERIGICNSRCLSFVHELKCGGFGGYGGCGGGDGGCYDPCFGGYGGCYGGYGGYGECGG